VLDRLGRPDLHLEQKKHIEIGFDPFEYGIIKRRGGPGETRDESAWKDGHPIVFPNMLRIGSSGDGAPGTDPRGPEFQIRTPIDDTHTAYWWVTSYQLQPGEPVQAPEDIPLYFPELAKQDDDEQPRWATLDTNGAQDTTMWLEQGHIVDRTKETLGRSDAGVIMFRKMLEDNIRSVEQGRDPINVFRDPAKNDYLWLRTEVGGRRGFTLRSRQVAATKHSPILNARGVAKPLEDLTTV